MNLGGRNEQGEGGVGMCDWLVVGAVVLNMVSWWINRQGERDWEELRTQYERYVRNLEAVVAQYEGRDH